eukprot:SAG31_NODE_169_length_21415_cov_29.765338_14_plen_49_part_00
MNTLYKIVDLPARLISTFKISTDRATRSCDTEVAESKFSLLGTLYHST